MSPGLSKHRFILDLLRSCQTSTMKIFSKNVNGKHFLSSIFKKVTNTSLFAIKMQFIPYDLFLMAYSNATGM